MFGRNKKPNSHAKESLYTNKITTYKQKSLSKNQKKNFAKSYGCSSLLYGCKTQTFTVQDKTKLESMEIWTQKRLVCIT